MAPQRNRSSLLLSVIEVILQATAIKAFFAPNPVLLRIIAECEISAIQKDRHLTCQLSVAAVDSGRCWWRVRQRSITSRAAPMVMAESAALNAGNSYEPKKNWRKSVTVPA